MLCACSSTMNGNSPGATGSPPRIRVPISEEVAETAPGRSIPISTADRNQRVWRSGCLMVMLLSLDGPSLGPCKSIMRSRSNQSQSAFRQWQSVLQTDAVAAISAGVERCCMHRIVEVCLDRATLEAQRVIGRFPSCVSSEDSRSRRSIFPADHAPSCLVGKAQTTTPVIGHAVRCDFPQMMQARLARNVRGNVSTGNQAVVPPAPPRMTPHACHIPPFVLLRRGAAPGAG